MAEPVEVGNGSAVEGEAHDLEGGAAAAEFEGVLAAGDHVALGHAEHVVRAWGGLDVPGAGDRDALADESACRAALLGRDVVEGAKLVVGTPAAPVGERVEVAERLGLGWGILLARHAVLLAGGVAAAYPFHSRQVAPSFPLAAKIGRTGTAGSGPENQNWR